MSVEVTLTAEAIVTVIEAVAVQPVVASVTVTVYVVLAAVVPVYVGLAMVILLKLVAGDQAYV